MTQSPADVDPRQLRELRIVKQVARPDITEPLTE
jgi:hypothetical protein